MESLNDLIWNPEDEDENEEGIDTMGIDDPMKKNCMAAFCGLDILGSVYACIQDRTYRSGACM